MRRRLVALAALAVVLVALLAGIELMATVYFTATTGGYVPARGRLAGLPNTFVEDIADGECAYVDTLYPHPYLGFVHHGNPPCGIPDINNVGLFGPDYPLIRPDDRFVVLLTGGSVASQFANGVDGGPSYLERFLNERYVSPTGRPFQVLNGGDGAWKQPQAAILFLLYADAVHGVVTLDGFNERYRIDSEHRFEYPGNGFHLVNPLARQAYGDIVAQWLVGQARRRVADSAVLSRSHAAFGVVSAAQAYVISRMESRPGPRTSLETMFALPAEWTTEERKAWAIGQYARYMRAMTAVARDQDVLEAHFIQPVPAIGKTLTPDEEAVAGSLDYAGLYQEMADALVALNGQGTPVVSLLDVFADDDRTLYADAVHLIRGTGNRSPGYEAMASRMADDLARLWTLRRR
jgi:hypothetical protein